MAPKGRQNQVTPYFCKAKLYKKYGVIASGFQPLAAPPIFMFFILIESKAPYNKGVNTFIIGRL